MNLLEYAERAAKGKEPGIKRRLPPNARRPTIQERFEDYIAAHPEVYPLLVRLARQVKNRGKSQYSMKALFEQARWFYHIEQGNADFKINNSFTAFYARLIMENEPDLSEFFETRKQRCQSS